MAAVEKQFVNPTEADGKSNHSLQSRGLAARLLHLEHTLDETKRRFGGSTTQIPIASYLKATRGHNMHAEKPSKTLLVDGNPASPEPSSHDNITTTSNSTNIHDISNFVTMLTTRPPSPPRMPGGLPNRQQQPTHHKQVFLIPILSLLFSGVCHLSYVFSCFITYTSQTHLL